MKYLAIIGNGLTDKPFAERDNKTVLQMAETPNLDRLARLGRTGSVQTIPEKCQPGNEISFLSLLGYDPEKYAAGAAGFVAEGLGVSMGKGEIPLCCDFVQLQSSHNDMIMKDHAELSAEDAKLLLEALQAQIAGSAVTFHLGNGRHNLMVLNSPPIEGRLTPPDELIGEGIRKHMPNGPSTWELTHLMNQAQIILHNHAFNKKREKEGAGLVNSVWFSGNGAAAPSLPPFYGKYGLNGSIITASILFQGVGKCAGLKIVPVAGATGLMNTDYRGKVDAALEELERRDVVYLQISAAENLSLKGFVDDKVLAVEDFDRQVVGPLLQVVEAREDIKMLLVVNHMCSAYRMKYDRDPTPFAVFPAVKGPDAVQRFDEEIERQGAERFRGGPDLMGAFFKGAL